MTLSLREALRTLLPPADRAGQEAAVAIVRAHLGPEGFEAAWAQGQVMTLEQAIAYALEELPSGLSKPVYPPDRCPPAAAYPFFSRSAKQP